MEIVFRRLFDIFQKYDKIMIILKNKEHLFMQQRGYDFTFFTFPTFPTFPKNVMTIPTKIGKVMLEGAYFSANYIKEKIVGPKIEVSDLVDAAFESKDHMVIKKMGLTGKHYGLVIVQSQKQFQKIIAHADSKRDGRYTHHAFDHLARGNFFANTGSQALKDHKILLHCLSHDLPAYTKELHLTCQEIFGDQSPATLLSSSKFKENIEMVFLHLFSKMLFGFRFSDQELKIINKSTDALFSFHGSPFAGFTAQWSIQFYKLKLEYYQMIKNRMLAETKNVVEALRAYPSQKSLKSNYLLRTIIELIKSDHPQLKNIDALLLEIKPEQVKKYLHHPKVLESPLILAGLSNLIDVSIGAIEELNNFLMLRGFVQQLADYFIKQTPSETLQTDLQRLCLDALQKNALPYISRYFNEAATLEGLTIPRHTALYIYFKPSLPITFDGITLPRQYPLTPFSVGPRSCPAIAPSMAVIKQLVLFFAEKASSVKLEMLFKAVVSGDAAVLETLVLSGIDLSQRNPNERGNTALHMAVHRRQHACVKLLIQAGADVNAQNDDNETPLHMAVFAIMMNDQPSSSLEILLQAGARTDLYDSYGTPVKYAKDFKLTQARRILEYAQEAQEEKSVLSNNRSILFTATVMDEVDDNFLLKSAFDSIKTMQNKSNENISKSFKSTL